MLLYGMIWMGASLICLQLPAGIKISDYVFLYLVMVWFKTTDMYMHALSQSCWIRDNFTRWIQILWILSLRCLRFYIDLLVLQSNSSCSTNRACTNKLWFQENQNPLCLSWIHQFHLYLMYCYSFYWLSGYIGS